MRDYEEQSEFERKRRVLREELAVVTNRLLELENRNLSTSSNTAVHSSSLLGVHTHSAPSASLNLAVLSGTSSNTNSISTLGYTGLANQLGGAPPGRTAPTGSSTFYDKDSIQFYAMDKRTAEKRIKEQQGFRRACDHDRKQTLLGNEHLDFDAQYIMRKLVSYGQRLTNLTLSAGGTLTDHDFEETWNPCRKLCEEAVYTLPIIKQIDKFALLLNWQVEFRDYTALSLDHFAKEDILTNRTEH